MASIEHALKDTISKAEAIDIYKEILQNQSSNYTTLINTMIAMTVVLLGSTWLWNVLLAKRQIKIEVEELAKENRIALQAQLEKQMNKKFAEFEEKMNRSIKNGEAEHARLFALYTLEQAKDFHLSLMWWARSLKLYAEIGNDQFIRINTDMILNILKLENWFESPSKPHADFDIKKIMDTIEKCVPPLLINEKNQILTILKSKLPQA